MFKACLFIPLLIAFFSGCDHNASEKQYKVIVSKITKGGLTEWYEVQEQYLSPPCNKKYHFASAYLCTDRKNDTVLVIDPCNQNKHKKHDALALFVDKNVILNDTVIINIPKRYEKFLHQERKLSFGTLLLPID